MSLRVINHCCLTLRIFEMDELDIWLGPLGKAGVNALLLDHPNSRSRTASKIKLIRNGYSMLLLHPKLIPRWRKRDVRFGSQADFAAHVHFAATATAKADMGGRWRTRLLVRNHTIAHEWRYSIMDVMRQIQNQEPFLPAQKIFIMELCATNCAHEHVHGPEVGDHVSVRHTFQLKNCPASYID